MQCYWILYYSPVKVRRCGFKHTYGAWCFQGSITNAVAIFIIVITRAFDPPIWFNTEVKLFIVNKPEF